MRHADIESWVLRVADLAVSRHEVEDARVELKSIWPADHRKAARHIAGLANAARGEPVLWIIGITKEGEIKGATDGDVATWWKSVRANFDEGIWPELTNLAVPYREGTQLVGLHFETNRIPYVVKAADGMVQREVTWREGTDLRTARRSDLLRLLSPLSRLPQVEVLDARVVLMSGWNGEPGRNLDIQLDLYFYLPPEVTAHLPDHLSRCDVQIETMSPLDVGTLAVQSSEPHLPIYKAHGQILIRGPGATMAYADMAIPNHVRFSDLSKLRVRWEAGLAGDPASKVMVAVDLDPVEVPAEPVLMTEERVLLKWELRR